MKTKLLLLGCLFFLLFTNAPAQEKWEIQFRPGLNFTTEDFAGANIKTGFGFEFAAAYQLTKGIGVFAGWGWNEFRTDEIVANSNFDVEETGYSAGLQFISPIKNTRLSYFIQAAAIYNHFELEDTSGAIFSDSGHGFGWQVGTGIESGIGNNFYLRPSIRFRSLSRGVEIIDNQYEATLNYISVGVALVKRI